MSDQKTTATTECTPYGLRKAIEAVKEAVTIPEYLKAQGVELKHNRARCIVHGGSNPYSFSVNPDKQLWHCFACGSGGDLVDLVRTIEGGELWEAMFSLAQRYSVELPQRPAGWREWQERKDKGREQLQYVIAKSYQRRFFRFFREELAAIPDPEERDAEALEVWRSLWPMAWTFAAWRVEQ